MKRILTTIILFSLTGIYVNAQNSSNEREINSSAKNVASKNDFYSAGSLERKIIEMFRESEGIDNIYISHPNFPKESYTGVYCNDSDEFYSKVKLWIIENKAVFPKMYELIKNQE